MGITSPDLSCKVGEEIICTADKMGSMKLQSACMERADANVQSTGDDVVSPCIWSLGREDWMTSMHLPQDMQEELYAHCVSNELIRDWASHEQQALNSVSKSPPALPLHVRDATHRFLQHLTQFSGLPMQKWFEVVTLFDVYHLKKTDGVTIDSIPATCAALLMLVKKGDCATVRVGASNFAPQAAQLAQWLQRLGFSSVSSDVTEAMLFNAERDILQALGWRISIPTLESWTSTYCARFNILTQHRFIDSLKWVWQRSVMISRFIMMRNAVSSEVLPQKIAGGLLALGLVAARLLPGEALRPPRISSADWNALYVESDKQKDTLAQPLPSEEYMTYLLEILGVTLEWSLSQVQEACLLTATIVRGSLVDMHGRQQADGGCGGHNTSL